MSETMTYAGTGVDYDVLDQFKHTAQVAGQETARNLSHFGLVEVAMSRGESAYLIEAPDFYLAHVTEGLGTKSLVADVMYRLTGRSFYDHLAQDTVGMYSERHADPRCSPPLSGDARRSGILRMVR